LSYTSVYLLLQAEFTTCQELGTSVKEQKSGSKVRIKLLDNKEIILFFKTDHALARERLQVLDNDKKSCDYLILYLEDINSKKESLCFLELKGSDFDHAVEQILSTHKYVNAFLGQNLEKDRGLCIVQGASICMHGSAPDIREQKKGRDRLMRVFGSDQYIHIKHGLGNSSYDLGSFMRKLYSSPVR
jgi:hypothetical protein